jgi:hypothetical protein
MNERLSEHWDRDGDLLIHWGRGPRTPPNIDPRDSNDGHRTEVVHHGHAEDPTVQTLVRAGAGIDAVLDAIRRAHAAQAERATMSTRAILRRERLYGDSAEYEVRVRGEMTEDDGLEIDMGPVTGAWYEVPLPQCPDCGGDLHWWEAGYVPGTRKCVGKPTGEKNGEPVYDRDGGCGSLFSVQTTREPEPAEQPERLRARYGGGRYGG